MRGVHFLERRLMGVSMFSVIFRGRVRVTTVIQKGIGVLVRFRVGRLGPSRAEFKPKVCLLSVKLGLALTQTLTP